MMKEEVKDVKKEKKKEKDDADRKRLMKIPQKKTICRKRLTLMAFTRV